MGLDSNLLATAMLLLPTLWLYINLDQDLRRQAPVEDDIESQRDPRRSLQRGKNT